MVSSARSREQEPPRPPRLRREIVRPGRAAALLGLTLALPVCALAGLFEGDGKVPPGLPALRVGLVFITLMFAFRVLGKRELGRLSPFELVTLMLIPEVLSGAVQGEGSLLTGLVGLSTLLGMVVVTSLLAHRFEKVEHLVEPSPTVLVARGRLIHSALNAERILPDELFSEMRKQGLSELREVEWGVLENSGNITFVPARRDNQDQHRSGQTDDAPLT